MKGGNIQLSREFAEFAKTDPERAARIIDKFEPGFGTRAAGYALDAMAENAPPELVLSLIEKLNQRSFKAGEFRRSAANAIQRLMQREVDIGDPILDMLKKWLTQAETTAGDEGGKEENEDDQVSEIETREDKDGQKDQESRGSVLWSHGGVSILPHGSFPVLETITRILLHRKDSDGLLALYSQHLEAPEDADVWRALLRYVRFIHPAKIADLSDFLTRLSKKYPEISTTHDAMLMLAYLSLAVAGVCARINCALEKIHEKEAATGIWRTHHAHCLGPTGAWMASRASR